MSAPSGDTDVCPRGYTEIFNQHHWKGTATGQITYTYVKRSGPFQNYTYASADNIIEFTDAIIYDDSLEYHNGIRLSTWGMGPVLTGKIDVTISFQWISEEVQKPDLIKFPLAHWYKLEYIASGGWQTDGTCPELKWEYDNCFGGQPHLQRLTPDIPLPCYSEEYIYSMESTSYRPFELIVDPDANPSLEFSIFLNLIPDVSLKRLFGDDYGNGVRDHVYELYIGTSTSYAFIPIRSYYANY